MPEDIQELKDYLEEMRDQAILGQCCADLDVHDMTVLIAMINKFEKYEKALKELRRLYLRSDGTFKEVFELH